MNRARFSIFGCDGADARIARVSAAWASFIFRTLAHDAARGIALLVGGLAFVGLIAQLDYQTGPELSFGIFYLIPVAACAWWGGFSPGILLALAGAVAWHWVDCYESPYTSPVAGVWNGVVRFGTLVLVASLVSRLHAGVRRERQLARTDPLTGAANGRTFYETAATESERARRTRHPLTVAYLDLDNFKQLNDRLGHAAGDAALLHVVQTIRAHVRHSDLLARLGGDEFALLLPETEAEGTVALLDRLRLLLAQEMARKGWPVTVSVGAITFLRPAQNIDHMIRRVDALMYTAKRKGKGRIEHEIVHDLPDEPASTPANADKRVTARLLCDRSARVRLDGGADVPVEFATIRDISAGGVGIHSETQFPLDTLLIVDALSPGARTLLARVVHVAPASGGWLHGCELSSSLDGEDLRNWLDEPAGYAHAR